MVLVASSEMLITDVDDPVDLETFDFEKTKVEKKYGKRTVVHLGRKITIGNSNKIAEIIGDLYCIKGQPVFNIDRIVFFEEGLDWWKANETRLRLKITSFYLVFWAIVAAASIVLLDYSHDSISYILYMVTSLLSSFYMAFGIVGLSHDRDDCHFVIEA